VDIGPNFRAGDPLRRTVGRRHPAVDGGRELQDNPRAPGAAMVQVGPELLRDLFVGNTYVDLNTRRTETGDAGAGHLWIRVFDTHHNSRDARRDECFGARTGRP
jgi:hypothetical protein